MGKLLFLYKKFRAILKVAGPVPEMVVLNACFTTEKIPDLLICDDSGSYNFYIHFFISL